MEGTRTDASGTDTDLELLDALGQVSFDMMAIISQVAAARDMSLTQLRLVGILRDRTPTMSQLAEHLGLDRSTVSGLIDRAAKRGLVQRVANDADKRSARVTLTSEGHDAAAAGALEVSRGIAPLLDALSMSERADLAALLHRITAQHR